MTIASTAPPRLSVMVRLAAGRGVFRLASQLMAVALAVVWGAESFGRFANAMGLCAWLLFVPTAAEKAALKVLPRMRFLTAQVARLVVRLAAAPVLALVAAFAVALLVDPQGTVTLYLVTAAWSAATGLLMTVSGLQRLRGRPMLDAAAFGAMTAVVLAGTAVTWVAGWSPTTHLSLLLAGLLAVTGYSLAALPRDWVLGVRSGRRLLPALGRSTWLLGLSELLDVAALSTVYLVLALTGQTTDSGPLYLAVLVASMAGSLVLYQLKLYQPATSARLRGAGGAGGRARTFRLLRTAERGGFAFAAVVAVLVAFPAGRDLLATGSYVVLGAVLAVEVAVSTLVMYANFLLENTNSSVLTITSVSAVVGLVATALIALAVVPWLGAAGGLTALVLAAAVKAGTLRGLLLRRHPELHP
ncbi:hypothetical protein [Actinophytocola algeriensis]|uniref:O-antigen/teichoic acid export membrane protein n=1 Tax=Actinophytocola algeriensis TaxID=1768010 RepID=A0A7W7Q2K8_9PSEU|nr:hypothetical protein [Actinophytocola algeriensis]MBB4905738.1 hypothetical protein [Actinophytocola algeriensis]MBE1472577.1 hypothetical protein [Actinophytocola algeriensis]